MKKEEIIDLLKRKGFVNDGNATQLRQFTIPQNGRDSFFSTSITNRSNTSWGRGEYIIVPYDSKYANNEKYDIKHVLEKWKALAKKYENQFLIIGVEADRWELYDYNGTNLGGNDAIIQKIGRKMDSNKDKSLRYLAAIRTKPFVLLAGISGTGKSRIVRRLAQASVTKELQREYDPKTNDGADRGDSDTKDTSNQFAACPTNPTSSSKDDFDRWSLHKPANFELIQVKPNWHNSMEVVGYKSNIPSSHYEFTPFVEFVVRAWLHPDVPFFLCLDEMNLAPVEQYFAEFLSAIESRTIEDGEYMTDPIIKPFDTFGADLCKNMINVLLPTVTANDMTTSKAERIEKLKNHFKTKGLTLPANLIVMGTVNMDETTFSFSRKVLDRAMTIVMNDVDLDAYFSGKSDVISHEMDNDTLKALIERPINGRDVKDDDTAMVRKFFEAVNTVLDGTPFKLGYRAINEMLLYVSAAKVFGCDNLATALDQFTMMKILSRIEGDKRSIGNLLDALQEVITSDYAESNKKLVAMASTLNNSQFVSYWT